MPECQSKFLILLRNASKPRYLAAGYVWTPRNSVQSHPSRGFIRISPFLKAFKNSMRLQMDFGNISSPRTPRSHSLLVWLWLSRTNVPTITLCMTDTRILKSIGKIQSNVEFRGLLPMTTSTISTILRLLTFWKTTEFFQKIFNILWGMKKLS